jgi:hypothetical protein
MLEYLFLGGARGSFDVPKVSDSIEALCGPW